MPNIPPIYLPRRWIRLAKTNHMLSESEDGYHMTMCRKLTRGEPIFHGTPENVRAKCEECQKRASSAGVYIGTEGVRVRIEESPSRTLLNVVRTRGGRIRRKKIK